MKNSIKRMGYLLPIISFLWGLSCYGQNKREDLMRQSSVIIKGEVLLLQTSTVDWSDPSDLGVIRLQEVFEGDPQLSEFLQQPVTVKFKNIKEIKKGQTIIVYGNTWLVNDGVAITETGHEVIGENNLTEKNYKEEINNSQRRVAMDKIRETASKSELVVLGTVVSTKKMAPEKKFLTEHDPEWVMAEFRVEESLKGGNAPGSVVSFVFPGSQDVMWHHSPRFKEGMKQILFLSRETNVAGAPKQFTVTSREQVKDARDLELVRQALR